MFKIFKHHNIKNTLFYITRLVEKQKVFNFTTFPDHSQNI